MMMQTKNLMVKKKIEMILNQLTNQEWEDAREILQGFEDFSLFSTFGESMLKSLEKIYRSLDREELSHKNSVITSFFSKQ